MRFPRHARIFTGQIVAAPFLAFFFLLLVIFVFTQTLVSVPGVRIDLPSATPGQFARHPVVRVAMDRAGQLYYQAQAIQFDQLQASLRTEVKKAATPLSLVLQLDRDAQLGAIFQLQTLGREAGFAEILLESRPSLFRPGSTP